MKQYDAFDNTVKMMVPVNKLKNWLQKAQEGLHPKVEYSSDPLVMKEQADLVRLEALSEIIRGISNQLGS